MKKLLKGNEALAEAAIIAGCRHYFGYPITPQSEIGAYMSVHLPKVDGVFVQAESEVAAINMVLGAAAAGVRTMTSTSSPGMSLKTEAISYIAGSDLPCVLVNIQRSGPGLGGIAPSQADYFQATKALGHGDFKVIVYAPNSVQEIADLTFKSFEMSDKFRMPALILADGLLGQMMEPVEFPDKDNTEKVEKDWATVGHKNQRKSNVVNSLSLIPEALEGKINARYKRYEELQNNHVQFENYKLDDAETMIVAYGATSRIVQTAIDQLRENGEKVGMLRPITLWPFPSKEIHDRAKTVKKVLVVEMSKGQMVEDVKLAVNGIAPVEFFGRTGGVVPLPEEIIALFKGGRG